MTPMEYLEANTRANKRECLWLGAIIAVQLSALGWLIYAIITA